MMTSKLRQQLAWHAARLIWTRQESDWYRARSRAIKTLVRGWVPPADMPQRVDIQEQLRRMEGRIDETPQGVTAESQDRWSRFASLLYALENVMLPKRDHPEGDALYHSLQVFDLVRRELPYDEEALLAALLHAVGEAIDRLDPVVAGLAALSGLISGRTAWLIENLEQAQGCLDRSTGSRGRKRLEQSESYEELMVLARCDLEGRQRGVAVPSVDEALEFVRELSEACDPDEGGEGRSWWD